MYAADEMERAHPMNLRHGYQGRSQGSEKGGSISRGG